MTGVEPFHSQSGSEASLGALPSPVKSAMEEGKTVGAGGGEPTSTPGNEEIPGNSRTPTMKGKGEDGERRGSQSSHSGHLCDSTAGRGAGVPLAQVIPQSSKGEAQLRTRGLGIHKPVFKIQAFFISSL